VIIAKKTFSINVYGWKMRYLDERLGDSRWEFGHFESQFYSVELGMAFDSWLRERIA